MLPRKLCFFLIPAVLCVFETRMSAQANINENESSYIYVDANNGSDGNSGTAGSPLLTIQAAVNR